MSEWITANMSIIKSVNGQKPLSRQLTVVNGCEKEEKIGLQTWGKAENGMISRIMRDEVFFSF